MGVRYRSATPGTLLCLVATALLAVVSFNTPLIKSLYFLSATYSSGEYSGTIKLGTLGYCLTTGGTTTCTGPTVGYEFSESIFSVKACRARAQADFGRSEQATGNNGIQYPRNHHQIPHLHPHHPYHRLSLRNSGHDIWSPLTHLDTIRHVFPNMFRLLNLLILPPRSDPRLGHLLYRQITDR